MIARGYKLGLIARCDNGGLGIESVEFHKRLRPEKVLLVHAGYQNFPERFADCGSVTHTTLAPTEAEVCEFLDGLDSMLTIETPYDWRLFQIARVHGVRTVMKVNYEWLEDHDRPDCYVLPNRWHMDDVPGEEGIDKFVLGLPVDFRHFRYRQRTQARTFLHIVGHNAGHDRNGTEIVARALAHSRADYRLIVRSQVPRRRIQTFNDPRVVMRDEDLADNIRLYDEADVLILPRRYGGQSLVMEEAAACGMPMVTTAMEPQLGLFAHSSVFIPLSRTDVVMVKRPVMWGDVDPRALAVVIDDMADATASPIGWIGTLSSRAPRAVYERTWEAWSKILKPR